MVNLEALVKQEPEAGKWGYVYTYKSKGKQEGQAGQSGFIYETQAEAEAAITGLSVGLSRTKEECNWKKMMLLGAFGVIAGVMISNSIFIEIERRHASHELVSVKDLIDKSQAAMMKDYQSIKDSGILMPIDKVIDEDRLNRFFEREKEHHAVLTETLGPINYQLHRSDLVDALNQSSFLLGEKMQLLSEIQRYKHERAIMKKIK